MATYEVDTLAELEDALDTVDPGDTILIRGGTYQPTGEITVDRSGTEANPITIKNYPSEDVIFDGTNFNGTGWHPPMINITADWNIFEGVDGSITVRNNPEGQAIRIPGDDNVIGASGTIFSVICHDNYGNGICVYDGSRNKLYRILAYDNGTVEDPGDSDGIGLEADYDNCWDNEIYYCECYGNGDDGIDLWDGGRTIMENCISHDNGLGVGDGNGFKYGPSDQHLIKRCIAYGNEGNGFEYNGGTGTTVDHCTSALNDGLEYGEEDANTYRDNIHLGTVYMGGTPVQDHNTWNLGITDPEFISVDPLNEYFLALAEGSPCIDAGSDGSDLGALQYGYTIADLLNGVEQGNGEPPTWVEDKIGASLDDTDCTVSANNVDWSYIYCPDFNGTHVGFLRFVVNVADGSTIANGTYGRAWKWGAYDGGVVQLQATDEDDAANFASNPWARALSGPTVNWTIPGGLGDGDPIDSPELKTFIQTFIDRGGYIQGNHIAIKITRISGGADAIYQFDENPAYAALIHIEIEGAGGEPITLSGRSATTTRADIAINTSISLVLKSATSTRAELSVSVATPLIARSTTETRSDITLAAGIILTGTSASTTRSELTLESAITLSSKSTTVTRAELALAVGIGISIRSITTTRSSIILTIIDPIDIAGRSTTLTRSDINLDTSIGLAGDSRSAIRSDISLAVGITLSGKSLTSTRSNINLDTTIIISVKSTTNTRSELALAVAINVACGSTTPTRAEIALAVGISISLGSVTDTRTGVSLYTVIAIWGRSETNTRSAIALGVLVGLLLRSTTLTRCTLELTERDLVKLLLRVPIARMDSERVPISRMPLFRWIRSKE